ncbi:MAG: hypothetical protein R6V19_12185 [Armatimonadota bacterium]
MLARKRYVGAICFIAVMVTASAVLAQEMTNHALGRPYQLSHAPATSRDCYMDTSGPEAYTESAFYRGELTDGVVASDNYQAAEWVLWRNSNYETFHLTIDLQQQRWIDRVDVRWFARNSDFRPPETAALAVLSPDFPYSTFVRIGQMQPLGNSSEVIIDAFNI